MPRKRALPASAQVEVAVTHGNLSATVTVNAALAEAALVELCDIVTRVGERRADAQPAPDTVPGGSVEYTDDDYAYDGRRAQPPRTIRGLTG